MKIPTYFALLLFTSCAPKPIIALPSAHVKPLASVQVMRDYSPYKPVAPRDWREQNFEVAPPLKEGKR
jgi:hypothetical protein